MTNASPPSLPPNVDAPKLALGPWQVFLLVIEAALVVAILGIHLYVVPRFERIFVEQGEKLPKLTRMLLDVSDWQWPFAFLWMLAFALVTLSKFHVKNATTRDWWDVGFLIAILGYIALIAIGVLWPALVPVHKVIAPH